jgi:hypothetical protein
VAVRCRSEQVEQERRAPTGTVGGEVQQVRRKPRRFGGGQRKGQRVLARQRAELDPHVVVAFERQTAVDVTAGDDDDPGRGLQVARDGIEQRHRGGIHQLHVVDLDERRHDQHGTQQSHEDVAKLGRLRFKYLSDRWVVALESEELTKQVTPDRVGD